MRRLLKIFLGVFVAFSLFFSFDNIEARADEEQSELEYLLSLPCTERPKDVWLFKDITTLSNDEVVYWTTYKDSVVSFPNMNTLKAKDFDYFNNTDITIVTKADYKFAILTGDNTFYMAMPELFDGQIYDYDTGQAVATKYYHGVFKDCTNNIVTSLKESYPVYSSDTGYFSTNAIHLNFNPLKADESSYLDSLSKCYLLVFDAEADDLEDLLYKINYKDLGDWFYNEERIRESRQYGDGKILFEFDINTDKVLTVSWSCNDIVVGETRQYIKSNIDLYFSPKDSYYTKCYTFDTSSLNSTYEGSFQVSLEEIGITSNGELKLEFEEGIYKSGVGVERFNIDCFNDLIISDDVLSNLSYEDLVLIENERIKELFNTDEDSSFDFSVSKSLSNNVYNITLDSQIPCLYYIIDLKFNNILDFTDVYSYNVNFTVANNGTYNIIAISPDDIEVVKELSITELSSNVDNVHDNEISYDSYMQASELLKTGCEFKFLYLILLGGVLIVKPKSKN